MAIRGFIVLLLAAWAGRAATLDRAMPSGETPPPLLALAEASRDAYDDRAPGKIETPSGCVALSRLDGAGNLIIAFRGSMLGDRDPARAPFSHFGGRVLRRNYRDWIATNVKQTAGFLPRQYTEAAELAVAEIRRHPEAERIFITGHSKGGGAAAYAAVHAWLSAEVEPARKRRIAAVTFNAAVVRESNWRRLYRLHDDAAVRALRAGAAPTVITVVMADDPVSAIARRERAPFSRLLVLKPPRPLPPREQHGIEVVIETLRRDHEAAPARDPLLLGP